MLFYYTHFGVTAQKGLSRPRAQSWKHPWWKRHVIFSIFSDFKFHFLNLLVGVRWPGTRNNRLNRPTHKAFLHLRLSEGNYWKFCRKNSQTLQSSNAPKLLSEATCGSVPLIWKNVCPCRIHDPRNWENGELDPEATRDIGVQHSVINWGVKI